MIERDEDEFRLRDVKMVCRIEMAADDCLQTSRETLDWKDTVPGAWVWCRVVKKRARPCNGRRCNKGQRQGWREGVKNEMESNDKAGYSSGAATCAWLKQA